LLTVSYVLEEPKMMKPFEEGGDLQPLVSLEVACSDTVIPDEHLAACAVLRARFSQLSSRLGLLLKAFAVRRLKAAVGEQYALICLQTKVKSFVAALQLTRLAKVMPDCVSPRLDGGVEHVADALVPVISIKPRPVPQLSLEFVQFGEAVEDQTTKLLSESQVSSQTFGEQYPINKAKQALGIARGSAVSAVRTASTSALKLSKNTAAAIISSPIIGSDMGMKQKTRCHSPPRKKQQQSRRCLPSSRPEPPQAELLLFAQQTAFAALWPPNMSDAARGRPRTAPLLKLAHSFS
jgi:hypothetical protein